MSNTSNASKNVRRFLLLFALGVAYGFMYVMPYMKSSFYDRLPDDLLHDRAYDLLSARRLDRR